MNLFNRAYCRTFQMIFKFAIPILPYRDPIVVKSTREVGKVLIKKNINGVLIVTDSALNEMGMLQTLYDTLDGEGIGYTVYDKTVPNPTVTNVEEARNLYLENDCNGLIGFGGGSSIDCAKAVGARIAKPRQPIKKMKGILKVCKRIPYLIAIPTTAGTGSETTVTTVITDGNTHHKFTINDFPLIPGCAVLDAKNTTSLPPSLTATTGMDAMTHAVEAYIGNSTTKATRADAKKAVKLICDNLETVYKDGENTKAREAMLEAAYVAGRAFSKSYVGYCHAVAHTLGGKYNIPHGLANAVLLPYVLKAYGKSAHKKLKDLAVVAGLADKNTDCETASKIFISKIEDMNRTMNIPQKLSGITEEDIPDLAKKAAKEANPLYPVPKLMSAKELWQFYYDVMEK